MDERRLFSAADEEAIRAAVADAEQRSAGEVVPWIVEACDPYPEAGWKAAALGASGRAVDLVAVALGGVPVAASDEFFSEPLNLLMPDPPADMGDGWETRRRRGPGHDWVVIRLGHRGVPAALELDTTHFKGNFPDGASLEACDAPDTPLHAAPGTPGIQLHTSAATTGWTVTLDEGRSLVRVGTTNTYLVPIVVTLGATPSLEAEIQPQLLKDGAVTTGIGFSGIVSGGTQTATPTQPRRRPSCGSFSSTAGGGSTQPLHGATSTSRC